MTIRGSGVTKYGRPVPQGCRGLAGLRPALALSDGRSVDSTTEKAPPVGNTVDVENAQYRNDIGAVELAKLWTDPDFDPDERAFYYARVLEIPTPRWTTYDAAYFGVELPDEVPRVQQDRAYTSPIWYTP